MARAAVRQIVIGVAASALLMGCVQGGNPFAAGPKPAADGSVAPAAAASPKGNRDVEAPEVFQVNDTALWDGRPSLGGVWVASPDTKDPERVIMRNTANGQTVVGALFRRERDNPGPKLQISSDAAEALGLLAGQPAEISVTALRREEVAAPVVAAEVEPVVDPVAEPAIDATAKPATEASAIETTAIATAALDKVDGTPAADAAADPAAPPVAAPPVKETRKTRREKAAAAKAAAAAAAAAPLDATAAAGAAPDPAATPEKPKTRKEKRAEAAAAKRAAAEAAATPIEAAPLPALETPITETPAKETPAPAASRPIQIGFFSEEANANRAVAALTKAGVPATARKDESAGKVYWTVTARGDAATLKKAKAAGFADAYFLK